MNQIEKRIAHYVTTEIDKYQSNCH